MGARIFDFKSRFHGLVKRGKDEPKFIALLVDGPNMIRSEFNLDLADVQKELAKYGVLKVSKVFLNQYASDKLIEAVSNMGFEPVVNIVDADVPMAIAAVDLINNPSIDIIALMTRDSDLQPVLTKAKAHGKGTIVVATEDSLGVALKNTADVVIIMDKNPEGLD
ncbi:MAG: TIGR00288 family NYN domain-containing protein [Candidatus Diapherotrites archaeon]|nr:TIGR00288 family NYN domain-containing protein [Candidatus Diapherotrites archaeon]